MRRFMVALATVAGVLSAGAAAQAGVLYRLLAVSSYDGRFHGDFALLLDAPPAIGLTPGGDPLPTEVQAADMISCNAFLDGVAMTCARAVFTPNYDWGGAVLTDAIDFYFTGSPEVEAYGYQFPLGSFLHARHTPALTMSSILDPQGDPGPTTGYLSVGVPEPGQWALMLAGFALVGAGLRSRRAAAAT